MVKKKVRRLKMAGKIMVACSILLLISFLVAGYYCFSNFSLFSSNHISEKEINTVTEKEKYPKKYSFDLLMVGDALIHSAIYEDALLSDGSYDFKPMLEYIKPISSKYDLAYYNQETILGGEDLGYSNYPRFNSPDEVGDAFIDAGFNLVSLATNHTMDKGEAGVLHSVHYWSSQKDVVWDGQRSSQEERDKVRIYECNGIKYAFFSYTTWTNGLETPVGKEYLNNVYSNEKAKNDIEKVKDKVDVIIVAMHWGVEYSTDVSQEQEMIANYLSSLGVNLIIGSHPHVVEPVEYINDGKTLVIYSLGNFISDQVGIERLTGLMMEVTINKVETENSTVVTVDNPKVEFIYTDSSYGRKRNFKVYPYSQLTESILPNYMNYYNQYKNIVSSRYPKLSFGLSRS